MPDEAALQRLLKDVSRQSGDVGGTLDLIVGDDAGPGRRNRPFVRVLIELAEACVSQGENTEILQVAIEALEARVVEGLTWLDSESIRCPEDANVPATIDAYQQVLQALEMMGHFCVDAREEQLRAGIAALESAMHDIEELVTASRETYAIWEESYGPEKPYPPAESLDPETSD